MAILGIDLGTTNSLGCVFRDGKLQLIPNKEGSFLTPSAVSLLEDGKIIVGAKAKERKITHPNETVLSFKKQMGSDQKISLGKKSFLPEELSAFVIRSIVDDAEAFLGEKIEEAVISVPAYFHDKQRAATKRAGALAGVRVDRILNEPSAAALSSYWTDMSEKQFLVFDFGGGTLDVSLVDCIGHIVQISAVAGNNRLGGDDFDALIANEVLKEHGIDRSLINDQEYAVLLKKARLCKEELSNELFGDGTAKVQVELQGKVCESEYTTKRLIKESKEIVLKIRNVINSVLKDGNVNPGNIGEIIMVGGSSKMPLIQSYMRHLFHKQPVIRTDCDEAIALGLGVFCGIKEADPDVKGYMLTDVCPFSLGTSVNNETNKFKNYMSTIIPRNSILPCTKKQVYVNSVDFQKETLIDIRQGEELYAKDNLSLGSIKVKITPKPAGKERIEVKYTYDINGILIVEIYVPSMDKTYTKVLSENLSDEELRKRMAELNKMRVTPEEIPENQQILENLEKLHAEVSPAQKETVISLMKLFQSALNEGNPAKIEKCKKLIELNLPNLETWDPLAQFEFFKEDDWDDPWAEDEDMDFFADFKPDKYKS